MKNAYAGRTVRDFNKPRDAVYASVHGIVEAFKPGTAPQVPDSSPADNTDTLKPYLSTWKDSGEEQEGQTFGGQTTAPPRPDDNDQ
jgi:hypothetical protein